MISLEHLHGFTLLAALCLLIFVEECGVPLPFAPGDLLLAICGLAIRRGGLSPVVAIGAVYLTTLAGAMAGRELFDLVGARLLGRTRLRSTLERGQRLLERGGWPAVLVGRLTPGLRVTTTEVAGLLRLPRRTFLLGLAPAAAVYVGVFVGAGMLFGHAATGLLLHVEHRLGLWMSLLLVVLLWIAAAWLTTRLIGWSASRSAGGRA
jgi:membrane-associated protein